MPFGRCAELEALQSPKAARSQLYYNHIHVFALYFLRDMSDALLTAQQGSSHRERVYDEREI